MGSILSSPFSFPFAAPHPPSHPPAGPPPQIKYDVFLSFRGEDTRYNFISHLHKALDERGIHTFIDYDLNRGDEISPALHTAIEESRISMIIFSENYASSGWCLEELVKILECKYSYEKLETNKQIVIPVFYGVTPSDLRNPTESFADAFAEHEKRYKKNLGKVHRWKDALKEAANLSGWTSSSHKTEADFIDGIVEAVWQKLDRMSPSDTSNLVGIKSKIEDVKSLLCMGTNDVRSVGLWGIGGIGKTTLAEAVFNEISYQFKGCSYFARNVREPCELSNGLNCLQQELLKALLGDKQGSNNTYVVGRAFMKKRFSLKKVLIVFDDISEVEQIEHLIGGLDCLGPQSRIIITSRDRQVLENYGVPMNQVYKVRKLFDCEALELFYMYAFRKNHPTNDCVKLSERVVKYAGGIPLVLRVLGSHLSGRGIKFWESSIEKMQEIPNLNIYKVFKISYDDLDSEIQKMFLDIACFFKWSDIDQVKSLFEACDFKGTNAGIDVLVDKSLIAVHDHTITMHDLLEATAKEIVRRESNDPGKRSRLWDYKEIYRILTTNAGTETIEGRDMSKLSENIELNPSVFVKMHRLRILKFYYSSGKGTSRVHVSQGLNYNLAALSYLCWHGITSSLSSFSLENLVILDMSWSKVKELWKGALPLPKLERVDLSASDLTSCPDLSGSPNLKILDLYDCSNLREISPSIGRLNKLEFLDLSVCTSLEAIPNLDGLGSLKSLNLCECIELKRLPITIYRLKSLETLYLDYCSELDRLPEDIGSLNSLEILSAFETRIKELPLSMKYLKKIQQLNFDELGVEWPNQRDSDSRDDGKEFSEDDLHDKAIEYEDYWARINVDLSAWEMVKCLSVLPLGGTALEISSSLAFQDCTPLFDFHSNYEDDLKIALHTVQKVKKKVFFLLKYPGNKVPKWFDFRSTEDSISLSPNWLNQSFMGFALCIVVEPTPDRKTFNLHRMFAIDWTCKLKSKDGQSFIREGSFFIDPEPQQHRDYVFVHCPILPFSPPKICDAKEISFEVKKPDYYYDRVIAEYGVHLMYAKYVEEVVGSSHVSGDGNILSLANVRDNCEEVDEPHPKRLKETHC